MDHAAEADGSKAVDAECVPRCFVICLGCELEMKKAGTPLSACLPYLQLRPMGRLGQVTCVDPRVFF